VCTDVLLLEEPWLSSENKENKKPSSPVEDDYCILEDLPIISNEVGTSLSLVRK
jgi:hypothetical protein